MIKFTSPLIRTVAMTAFVGTLAFASPLHAQSTTSQAPQNNQMEPATSDVNQPAGEQQMQEEQMQEGQPMHAGQTSSSMAPMGQHKEMKVEERIKSLHAKLKITPPEENDWKAVAETMRENEAKIGQLIEARRQNPDNMTAVDDIESYRQITQAHADGLQKMASSFSTLYNDMPDAQKRNADQVFGHFEGRGKHGMKHAK